MDYSGAQPFKSPVAYFIIFLGDAKKPSLSKFMWYIFCGIDICAFLSYNLVDSLTWKDLKGPGTPTLLSWD